jgi:hypothetical protein
MADGVIVLPTDVVPAMLAAGLKVASQNATWQFRVIFPPVASAV